jgi:predicted GNAT family N-acyltransferase
MSRAFLYDSSHDEHCVHAVLCNRLGLPVATGRLLPSVNGVAKIGRMAVKRVLRGQRLGDQILSALMDAARARGDKEILLHAQCSAENFYRRQGFSRQGEVFMEANMAHVEMVCALE